MGQLWINDCPIYMGSWTDSRDVFKMFAFKDLTFWLLDLTHGGMNCESAAVIFVRLVEIAWWHALYPWHSNEQLHELGLVCQQRSDQFAHVLSDKFRLKRNWHDFVKWKKMVNLPFLSRLLLTKSCKLMPQNPKISSQFPWIPTGPRGNCWLLSMAPRVFQICAPAAGPSAHAGADGRRYHRGMDFGFGPGL